MCGASGQRRRSSPSLPKCFVVGPTHTHRQTDISIEEDPASREDGPPKSTQDDSSYTPCLMGACRIYLFRPTSLPPLHPPSTRLATMFYLKKEKNGGRVRRLRPAAITSRLIDGSEVLRRPLSVVFTQARLLAEEIELRHPGKWIYDGREVLLDVVHRRRRHHLRSGGKRERENLTIGVERERIRN